MLRQTIHGLLLGLLAFSMRPCHAQTATLKAQFIYGGGAPMPQPLHLPANANCGNVKLVNEELLVNQANSGIKNVAFYLFTGRDQAAIEIPANPGKTVTLENKNCRFEPHFVVLQTGDTLKVTNPDAIGHNANLNFLASRVSLKF